METLTTTTTQNLFKPQSRILLLETLIENAPFGILVLSPPELVVEVISPMAKVMIPIKIELGHPLFAFTESNAQVDLFLTNCELVLHTGDPINVSNKWVPSTEKGGLDHFFSYTISRLKLPGNRYAILIIGSETTELVTLQQELDQRVKDRTTEIRRAYSFVNAVIDNIPDMIFVKDAKNLRFTRINKAGEDLLGYKSAELIGKNDYDFFPKSEADFFVSKDRAVFETGSLVDIQMEPIHTKYKGERVLHTKKVPIYDDEGNPEFLLGISEDITVKSLAEENSKKLFQETLTRTEAERAIRLRDEFISIAAHELKTPLTSLRLQIQLLESFLSGIESAKTPQLVELMHQSKDQLDQFTKLVNNLLDVSRASSGHINLTKSKVNLTEIITKVSKHCQPELEKSKCDLTLDLEPEIVGNWDPSRMEQILVNLLSNAMKYGSGNPIEIKTWIDGTSAKLTIRDQGIGIAKADQSRIFNRFERVTSDQSYTGLGLGLYITKQIVDAHTGKISVESEKGKGSIFTLELPL